MNIKELTKGQKTELKQRYYDEKLDNLRTIGELKDIEGRLLKAEENK